MATRITQGIILLAPLEAERRGGGLIYRLDLQVSNLILKVKRDFSFQCRSGLTS